MSKFQKLAIFASLTILGCTLSPTAFASDITEMPYQPTSPKNLACSIKVDFTSHGDGIDATAYQKLRNYCSKSPNILTVRAYPWGDEGEKTLCIITISQSQLTQLYGDIRGLIPATPQHGQISIQAETTSSDTPQALP